MHNTKEKFKLTPKEGMLPHETKKKQKIESIIFFVGTMMFIGWLIVVYAIWFRYIHAVDGISEEAIIDSGAIYPYFIHVSIMIFVGFGFLMTFLRRYGYSAVGYTFLYSCLACLWSVPLGAFVYTVYNKNGGADFDYRYQIKVEDLLNGLFCAGAVMITMGAFLGKMTPTQMLFISFFEPIFYWVNQYVILFVLEIHDVGGGLVIHTFGAYYGLAICWWLTYPTTRSHPDNRSIYTSDIFALIGTLFLFVYWPSFNGIVARNQKNGLSDEAYRFGPGISQDIAVINTFLSICGSAIVTFPWSRILSEHKFDIVHIQNATLAGGVVMGVASDLNLGVVGAFCSGLFAGTVSTFGYKFLTPFISHHLGIQDICGVHNLHGMPGILSGLVGVFAAINDGGYYAHGKRQPGYQMAAICVTLGIAIITGFLSGFVLALMNMFNPIDDDHFFNDAVFWELPAQDDKAELNLVHKPKLVKSGSIILPRNKRQPGIGGNNSEAMIAAAEGKEMKEIS